jgi:glutathione S-transferase
MTGRAHRNHAAAFLESNMKIYGHPWSINSRKTFMTVAEKGHAVPMVLVMIPKGEQRRPEHLARHPFGKVPVLDDDGFVLYETRAINRYLDARLPGPRLTPAADREVARLEQWINVADAYFIPHTHALIGEGLFRRYLGGRAERGDDPRGAGGDAAGARRDRPGAGELAVPRGRGCSGRRPTGRWCR